MVQTSSVPARLRPTALETVCGLALGRDDQAAPLTVRRDLDARGAIDAAVRRALSRPPCLVSFSGGRDSSVLLAAATAVARREDLALPVPVTWRFPSAPGSHENTWQERVVAHLGLPDWERWSMGSELDVIGPVARDVMRRHGLLWPFNAHFHEPILRHATGGSVVTGIGGDQVFGRGTWAGARDLLAGRRRPRLRHARTLALPFAPRAVRRSRFVRRREVRWPWLHPEVDALANERLAHWRADTPLAWPHEVGWWWRSRFRTVLEASLGSLASATSTQIVSPFFDATTVGAIVARFGARGPADRTTAMRALFADILPDTVLARRGKAHFSEAFASDHTRAFVASWDGRGVDRSLVDVEQLRLTWQADIPDARSLQLLQSAWLHHSRPAEHAPPR